MIEHVGRGWAGRRLGRRRRRGDRLGLLLERRGRGRSRGRRGRRGGNGDDSAQTADFIPCVAFDRAGEFAEKYFHQGTKLVVTGRIQTGSYTNRDGQKVYTTEVIVEDQEFAESKNAASGNSDGGYRPAERPAPSSAIGDGFMNIPDGVEDEGLPFN